ncbi:MAG: magnesium transporter CorA family protein [Bacteroidales bacterium]|nr:magnesium transporter CorA family protein [Bacteroidales bacterium]
MIEYLECKGGFKKIAKWQPNCWIQVTKPTQKDLTELENSFNAPMDFIKDVEDTEERPRTENEDGWLMTLIRIPNKEIDEDGDSLFSTVPLAVLISGDILITICHYKSEMIEDFIRWSNRKRIQGRQRLDLMLSLFLSSSVWYLKYLKQMNIMMKNAEEALEESMENEQLQQMMRIEKFLVYFITSLRGNEVVLVRLKKHLRNLQFDDDLLDDVEVELQQAYTTANIYSDILERQRSGYASIISNNLNGTMKKLTTITIILMIPAAISGFFGMNVPNGMENWWFAFPLILLITVLVIAISYYSFKKRNLF